MKYLRDNPTTVDSDILTVSLVVTITDMDDFVSYASSLIRNTLKAGAFVLNAITGRPKQ